MNSYSSNNELKEQFVTFLKSKNMRKTPERIALLEYIVATQGHFTLEMLQRHVEENGFHVSRATVYNTVNLLVAAKFLHKHDIDGIPIQFELATKLPHFHLICTSCGKLKEVSDNHFIAFMNTRKYAAFTPQYYSLYAFGTCSTCARKMKRTAEESNRTNNNKR